MTTIKEIQKIQDERFEKWYEGLANPPTTSVVIKKLHERDKAIIEGVREEKITENTSDGYHTFKELYEHRILLFIALCRILRNDPQYQTGQKSEIWCSVLHSDGTKYDDWFILGIGKEKGEQITYHLPARFWNEVCEFAFVLDKAPEWDGHTSEDVLKRLSTI
jgi:hypothetical protein